MIVMPALPISMAKGLHKGPQFNTVVQKPVAARAVSSASLQPYATWNFEFDLDAIQGNESSASSVVAQFLGAYMACNGRNALFLFTDPQDHAVSYANGGMLNVTPGAASPMGTTGDGSSTQFQLARSIGGVAWDIIQNLNGSATVIVNSITTVPASVSSTGLVTFTSAPPTGAALQWSGSFYYACRFADDSLASARIFTTNNGIDQFDIESIKFSSEFQ